MTREIKFRAWDGKNMRYPNLVSTMSAPNHYTCYCTDDTDPGHFDTVDVMQFTGLKDKNGKEIYEGDIVVEEVETEYGKDKIKHDVDFNAGAFYPVCMQPSETFEVIGNIYENKPNETLQPEATKDK